MWCDRVKDGWAEWDTLPDARTRGVTELAFQDSAKEMGAITCG